MNLVDNINLVLAKHRSQLGTVNQITDIIDMRLIGRVDFNDIGVGTGDRLPAVFAFSAWCLIRMFTVDCTGKKPGHCRLSGSPWTAEKIGMANSSCTYRILNAADNVLLTDDLIKGL